MLLVIARIRGWSGLELATQFWMSVAFLICASSAVRWFLASWVCTATEAVAVLWFSLFWTASWNWMAKMELNMTATAIEQ